jgi:hypothetical protein
MVNGVEFQLSLLSATPALASMIAFVSTENGGVQNFYIDNGGVTTTVPETTTLRVESRSKWRPRVHNREKRVSRTAASPHRKCVCDWNLLCAS